MPAVWRDSWSRLTGTRLLDSALIGKTGAARNKRIVALYPGFWNLSGGGLQSLAKMVGDIGEALEK